MLKAFLKRIKDVISAGPKPVTHDPVADFLSQPFAHPQPLQVVKKAAPASRLNTEQLIKELQAQLRPRLVVNNVKDSPPMENTSVSLMPEPSLTQPWEKRYLNPEWVKWYQHQHGCTDFDLAWLAGASQMMDREFQEKMRMNVEILPIDPSDMYLVKIKYHDPGKETK
jgi:hypothetical protein